MRAAEVPTGSPPPAEVRSVEIAFGDDLGLTDIRLSRTRQSRTVTFVADPRWTPVTGSQLRFMLAHSPQLDPGRSFLSVTLNHAQLRSLRLDETNEAQTEIQIPLPPGLLQRRNELTFSVDQKPRDGGGDVWTLIGARSAVLVAYQEEKAWQARVRDLPLPLVDPAVPRPKQLGVLLPGRVTPATLEATALVVAYFSLRAAPQPLRLAFLRSLEDGRGPVLVVGSLAEQAPLREMRAGTLNWVDSAAGPTLAQAGAAPLEPSAGVVLLSTERTERPILAITGNTPEGVLRGAWGLITGPLKAEGPAAVIADEPPRVARAARQWKGFIPPSTGFRLSEAGYGPQVLRDDAPLRMTLRATPDTRFLGYGHSIDLSLRALPALLEQADARIEISWNDVVVRRLTQAEMPRKPPYLVSLRLPGEALRPENVLSLAWRSGTSGAAAGPLASLDPEASGLYLPRRYEAKLPDLGLLRASLYPISLHPDLSDVIVVTPDQVTEEVFVVLCEAAAQLGRVLPADLAGFRVRQPSALTAAERASAHLVLLRTGTQPDAFESAFPDWRKARESAGAVVVLQAAESPWSRGHHLLSLRGSSASRLLRGFRALNEGRGWERFSGDTAFVTSRGTTSVTLGTQRQVSEADYLVYVDAWLRSHWLALPLVLTVVSALLVLALRLALAHRQDASRYLTASSGASRPS